VNLLAILHPVVAFLAAAGSALVQFACIVGEHWLCMLWLSVWAAGCVGLVQTARETPLSEMCAAAAWLQIMHVIDADRLAAAHVVSF
jgi:hypothetical protein